jgi:cobalamin biosynthesis Mg chelatase CobN
LLTPTMLCYVMYHRDIIFVDKMVERITEQQHEIEIERAHQRAVELEDRRRMREQEKRMALVMLCATIGPGNVGSR